MIVDLRNNPTRSQLAPSRIKYREVQTTQIVHKKRHVLTIRYFQKSLKIAIFTLWSLRFEPNHENVREGKASKEKPLPSLETVANLFFSSSNVLREISLIQTPSYKSTALNKFIVSLPTYISSFFKSKWYIRAISRSALKIPRDLFKVLFLLLFSS